MPSSVQRVLTVSYIFPEFLSPVRTKAGSAFGAVCAPHLHGRVRRGNPHGCLPRSPFAFAHRHAQSQVHEIDTVDPLFIYYRGYLVSKWAM